MWKTQHSRLEALRELHRTNHPISRVIQSCADFRTIADAVLVCVSRENTSIVLDGHVTTALLCKATCHHRYYQQVTSPAFEIRKIRGYKKLLSATKPYVDICMAPNWFLSCGGLSAGNIIGVLCYSMNAGETTATRRLVSPMSSNNFVARDGAYWWYFSMKPSR